MSPGEKWVFWSYLLIQLLLPLKHFLCIHQKGRSGSLIKSDRPLFAWTMMFFHVKAAGFFTAYEKDTRRSLGTYALDDFLIPWQARFLYFGPGEAVQLAKHLAYELHKEKDIPLDNIDVRCYYVVDVNEKGAMERIREDVDLSQEPIRLFSNYPWYHPE